MTAYCKRELLLLLLQLLLLVDGSAECRIKYSQILTTATAASATIASCLLMGWGEGQ